MRKTQLNAQVPETAKETLKAVSRATGIKIEELVFDALKLLAGEEDRDTKARARLFKQTCKLKHLNIAA